jgi:putative ABC transport system permease protein
MIKHYLKIAWRNLFKSKTYSVINIVGLAAGLSSFIIILLYLNYELSYDKWNPHLGNIVRVSVICNGDILQGTPTPLASFLADKYPDAQAATSFQSSGSYESLIVANNKSIYQDRIIFADSSFLKVFPYTLLKGDAATALDLPNAIILSEAVSSKFFGVSNPIGKLINIQTHDCIVTGVMKEPAGPSHINCQAIMRDPWEKGNKFWENYSNLTYIRLKHRPDNKTEGAINRLFYNERLKKDNLSFEANKKTAQQTALFTDAMPSIHNFPKHGSSNFTVVSVLLILAILLLLAGAINFSNLDTAKAMSRAKEVGVRKVLGSGKKQVIFQFMTETALQCIISLCLAVVIVYFSLPYLNHSFNISLGFWHQGNAMPVMIQIALCLLAVIIFSGLYPSLLLSRFNTTKILKGNYSTGKRGMLFRNSLIVVQIMVSAFFIIAILIINGQVNYMQHKNKGFSGDQVMRIQAQQNTRDKNFDLVRNTLLAIRGVESVSKTTLVPGDKDLFDTATSAFKIDGKEYRLGSVKISAGYFKTLNVPLLKGRYFTEADPSDQHTRTAIINEAAAMKLNVTNPVGKFISFPYCDSVLTQVVGVVKDFNVAGFESKVQPLVYTIGNEACAFQSGGAMLVKINGNTAQSAIDDITQAWTKIEPGYPLRYSFIDENFAQLFLSYTRLQKIISFFAFIAILISAMGLFALTAFYSRQRTKEIGIRKVLGASINSLAALLSKDFIRLVVVAIIITTPIAWWALNKWLQTFAYRIAVSWFTFLLAGLIIFVVTVLTVSVQAIRTSLLNPVNSLRTE